jgi:DNA-binding protein HU-beta
MNKTELVKTLIEKSGQDKKTVDSILTALDEVVKSKISEGESVALVNLGTFKVSDRPARTARNPMTGETIQVPAKKVAKFSLSKSVKEIVSGKTNS